jgi:CRISPR system Cascade subunit CasB
MGSEAKDARYYVKYKISSLLERSNESSMKAILANLRKGIGKPPGSMPELWSVTYDGMPKSLISHSELPSRGEWAIHTSLTLFALHQQGKDVINQPMYKDGETLGRTLRKLIKNEEDEKRVKRRFDSAATSDSLEEFSHHLRGLVQIMKAQSLPLDYPLLTEELFWFQIPEYRDNLRLKWGRDFYQYVGKEEK